MKHNANMGEDIETIKKDLNEIKLEINFIKEWLIDDEANLEVSDEVVREVEESRKGGDNDLVSHEEVFKKYCK